jgi:hypothetical protein
LATLSQLDRLGKSRKGKKSFLHCGYSGARSGSAIFSYARRSGSSMLSVVRVFAINPRMIKIFQKLLAKSNSRH